MHCPQSKWGKYAILVTENSGTKSKPRQPNNDLDIMWCERSQKQNGEFLPF